MRSRSRAGIRQPLTLPVTQAAAASRRNLIESGHPYTDSCTRKGGLPATTRDLPPLCGDLVLRAQAKPAECRPLLAEAGAGNQEPRGTDTAHDVTLLAVRRRVKLTLFMMGQPMSRPPMCMESETPLLWAGITKSSG